MKFASAPTRLFVCLLLTLMTGGCFSTQMMVRQMYPLMEEMSAAVHRNPDIEMVRDAFPANLIQLDGLIEVSPDNTDLLLMAAEAYCGYSFSFIEGQDRERAKYLYRKARDYALRVLFKEKRFRKAWKGNVDQFTAALRELHPGHVPALFWASNSWLSLAGLSLDNPETFLDLPKIEAMMNRVIELDETFYYGATHAGLGAYHASRSKTNGGDPEKARYHFDRAFTISKGKLLAVHLLYAKYYSYQIQDRELYLKTLAQVINSPEDILPEQALANAVARRKADRMIEEVDELF